MPQKKQATKTARKSTTTKQATTAEPFRLPRAKRLAEAIQKRMKTSPGYWAEVQLHMERWADRQSAITAGQRIAQVEPTQH